MRIEFEIVSGARVGARKAFEKSYIALGRDTLSDVRFDPEADLDVSTKHSAVLLSGDGYVVRDLGSRNGTFVNGQRISGPVRLQHGDVVVLGFTRKDHFLEKLPELHVDACHSRVAHPI
jgi:pSer/pThr/pTyr-binding forkhead associated (FHA) protein